MIYKVGDKIKFRSEKQRYRVMACDSRYLICIKHFNLRQTFIYTVVDLVEKMRGPENLILGMNYDLFESADCELFLKDFQSGKVELSPRRSIPLDLE